MAKAIASDDPKTIVLGDVSQGMAECYIVGVTPLIFNRMQAKAAQSLLLGGGRKTSAERAVSLKHNPPEEFRGSVYRNDDDAATRLAFPAPGFKGALMTAALDVPGAKKTEIGRLCWIDGYRVDIYGLPMLLMSIVRSADINHTPDVRTRAIVGKWACKIAVGFQRPKLNERTIAGLLASAGMTVGIGDFRQEKGKGDFGRFRIAEPDDQEYMSIIRSGGIKAQDAALDSAACWDFETEDLMAWFRAEVKRRGRESETEVIQPGAVVKRGRPRVVNGEAHA